MVKGVSRQVIVVQSPDRELFEQAIFILKDGQGKVTDDVLLQEADRLLSSRKTERSNRSLLQSAMCVLTGALAMSILWALSVLF